MEILFLCAVCLAASTVGGICGVGGGVVIKPLLDAAGIMSVSTLSFLSGLTVLAMACLIAGLTLGLSAGAAEEAWRPAGKTECASQDRSIVIVFNHS